VGLTADLALDAYAIDGAMPRRYVDARSEADVVETIRSANEAGEAIVVWGGGTRISIGDDPDRYDTALDLRALSGILEHEPADLTVTVCAGTTVASLQAALAPHGQWWPVEVAHPERATVGGTIASAADGPSRFRYLHPRDWTIGVRAVLGDGTVARAGGRVVKNVTGYDLTKMYSGSYGTLCVLTELTLKLWPLPQSTLTLRIDLPSLDHAYATTRSFLRERLPLDAIALAVGAAGAAAGSAGWTALLVRLAGTRSAVQRLRGLVERSLGAMDVADEGVWPRIAALPADATTSVRGTWPPSRALEPYALSAVWYPGLEVAHLLDDQEDAALLRQVREVAEGRAGALIVERAPVALRRELGTWGTPRASRQVAQRLKALFDPRSVLAPGRMP